MQGSCQGKRQIFLRFAGCNLAESGTSCIWCDSPHSHALKTEKCRVEIGPGTGEFKHFNNPISPSSVIDFLKSSETPDLHSISFTGGEPLLQASFIEELCLETPYQTYLETNGTLPEKALKLAPYIDFACVDIKDETALPYKNQESLVNKEFETIDILKNAGARVFAKIVVTPNSSPLLISDIAKHLSEIGTPLAIQPVTVSNKKDRIRPEQLFKLSEAASQYLSADDITLSLQTHKYYGIM